MSTLHSDFPDAVPAGRWHELPDPLRDIAEALSVAGGAVSLDDLAQVERYFITSDDGKWEPGRTVATELGMTLLGTLKDGRWFGLEAWNDYTGWGCQDGSDLYIGSSRDDVIRNGLTNEGRSTLSVSLTDDKAPSAST